MQKVFLSVIIPTYNEEKRIPQTLLAIDKYLSVQKYPCEILVVESGSTDETASVVNNLTRLIKNLRLINLPENRGKGWAVTQGMLAANGKYRLFTDADNSTSIEHFSKMQPFLEQGYDVVIGSRALRESVIAVPQSLFKRLLGKAGNLFIQLVAVWGIWDTQCGFKVFEEKAANDIFSRLTIPGWGFDVETLAIARLRGYKIKEMPVRWVNDPFSHVTAKSYFQVLFETMKVRLNLLRKKYD